MRKISKAEDLKLVSGAFYIAPVNNMYPDGPKVRVWQDSDFNSSGQLTEEAKLAGGSLRNNDYFCHIPKYGDSSPEWARYDEINSSGKPYWVNASSPFQ